MVRRDPRACQGRSDVASCASPLPLLLVFRPEKNSASSWMKRAEGKAEKSWRERMSAHYQGPAQRWERMRPGRSELLCPERFPIAWPSGRRVVPTVKRKRTGRGNGVSTGLSIKHQRTRVRGRGFRIPAHRAHVFSV